MHTYHHLTNFAWPRKNDHVIMNFNSRPNVQLTNSLREELCSSFFCNIYCTTHFLHIPLLYSRFIDTIMMVDMWLYGKKMIKICFKLHWNLKQYRWIGKFEPIVIKVKKRKRNDHSFCLENVGKWDWKVFCLPLK